MSAIEERDQAEFAAHLAAAEERRQAQRLAHASSKMLNAYELSFNEGRNPLYIWAAWALCRRNNVALPEWAAEQLDQYAAALTALASNLPPRDVAAAAGKAIGFDVKGNGGNPFQQVRRLNLDDRILRALLPKLRRGQAKTAAFEAVAREVGSTSRTVERHTTDRLAQLSLTVEGFRALPDLLEGRDVLAHLGIVPDFPEHGE